MSKRKQNPTFLVGRWMSDTRRAVAQALAGRSAGAQGDATSDRELLDRQALLATEAMALRIAFGLDQDPPPAWSGKWDAWRERLPGTVFADPDLPTLSAEGSRRLEASGAALRPILQAVPWPEDLLIDLFEFGQAYGLAMRADGGGSEGEGEGEGGWDLVLDGERLKARGLFYTPAAVARRVVEAATCDVGDLAALLDRPPTLLDPAVGAGRFLIAALRRRLPRARRQPAVRGPGRKARRQPAVRGPGRSVIRVSAVRGHPPGPESAIPGFVAPHLRMLWTRSRGTLSPPQGRSIGT